MDAFQRVFAIVERELRKFVRTPMILFMTLLMPLMQLFVLGNAFGGRATHLQIAVVDEDGGQHDESQHQPQIERRHQPAALKDKRFERGLDFFHHGEIQVAPGGGRQGHLRK